MLWGICKGRVYFREEQKNLYNKTAAGGPEASPVVFSSRKSPPGEAARTERFTPELQAEAAWQQREPPARQEPAKAWETGGGFQQSDAQSTVAVIGVT